MLKVKRLRDDAQVPTKAHITDAGFDLYASEDTVIEVDGVTAVHTGIAIEMPPGIWIKIFAKSGLAVKHNLGVTAGVIDNAYRGEYIVAMVNYGTEPYEVKKGDKIAQMVVMPHLMPKGLSEGETEITVVEEFSLPTDRGEDGFGSSGR
jgi:dUTP pyrophosphatase